MEFKEVLETLLKGNNLPLEEAYEIAMKITKNEIDDILKSAILVALRCKGEKYTEIAGFAKALRDLAVKVGPFPEALDTAGTGGDNASLYNVSTATALLLAAMGYKVVKHGNRSISGTSGSADLLESLGYKINLTPEEVKIALNSSNFAFIFAPLYHPAMKNVMPVRKKLGIRTIFNLIGPLSNPASPGYQVVGVAEEWMLQPISEALTQFNVERAAVIHGFPGIDEVSPIASTEVVLVNKGDITKTVIDVKDFGIRPLESLDPLRVKSVEESKEKVLRALSGNEPEFTFLLVNASLALHVVSGIDIKDAASSIKEFVDSVDVIEKVRRIVEASGGTPTF
ncbi:anthranilate phosphoribosyltransferase [Ignicoccus islandicus DSM 13165]|uniref:Anthranilate phosphoribosyltransferase n=1 Tax=Ignicoccus islandicus DSM 13165 TaxID=940295 RepID=A0A0U3DX44_9CREN|nr:anthranilate phosphoribosyltransferase [Ignicoccus islandicus]ALU12074.1 anthranilate phosphoribosyltransferase [Ignicoccus islandicus DSM 13165]